MSSNEPMLEFTGERFTPECVREIWYEHMHRYAFAGRLVNGLSVCDAACGEGYGTALLRLAGAQAVGVDIDAQTIAHAGRRYGQPFVCASVTALPFPSDSFAVLTSFETIEHLAEQQAMLAEFRRVLQPDGMLIISSPDKAQYSDATGYTNPDHVCELYRQEFVALLEEQFQHIRIYGQRLMFSSMIARDTASTPNAEHSSASCHSHYLDQDMQLQSGIAQPAMYWIAVCSNTTAQLDRIDSSYDLFSDQQQSMYAHYHDQVRKNMRAGHDLQARDARIAELELQLQEYVQTGAKRPSWLSRLLSRKAQ
ncbi:MAG: class I SAM-dependent methyltransferase [Gammaproteobacteria bacterium]|jgi:SAM-dependent methyltransferase|nr:class I SAM-dependent methyltransferase [Gammaproteobacteria bacterium]